MPRDFEPEKIAVLMNEKICGILEENKKGNYLFRYTDKWLSDTNHPVSLSLPLKKISYDSVLTENFFANTLPDSESVREGLAKMLHSGKDTFSLIRGLGGDCAGALQAFDIAKRDEIKKASQDTLINKVDVSWKNDTEMDDLVRSISKQKLGIAYDGERRMSLAGAQEKTSIFISEDETKFGVPLGNTPSTHIIKRGIQNETGNDLEGGAINEFFCLNLASRLGLESAETKILKFNEESVISSKRFDRKYVDGGVQRIHQEDFCQALGVHPSDKYEYSAGQIKGPGVVDCMDILKNSKTPEKDRLAFTKAIMFNYLIGGSDAHAKNYGLLHDKKGFQLAPLYDIASGLVYSWDKPVQAYKEWKMAMSVNGKSKGRLFNKIRLDYWKDYAKRTGMDESLIISELKCMSENIVSEAQKLKQECEDNGIYHNVLEGIVSITEKHSGLMLSDIKRDCLADIDCEKMEESISSFVEKKREDSCSKNNIKTI